MFQATKIGPRTAQSTAVLTYPLEGSHNCLILCLRRKRIVRDYQQNVGRVEGTGCNHHHNRQGVAKGANCRYVHGVFNVFDVTQNFVCLCADFDAMHNRIDAGPAARFAEHAW